MYKYTWKILTEMKMYGDGKFWELTYIHRGGVKCVNQNFPRYIICDRKNFEKNFSILKILK